MWSSQIFNRTSYLIDKKFPRFTHKYTIISNCEVLGEAVVKKISRTEVGIMDEKNALVAKIMGQPLKIARELEFTNERDILIARFKWKKAFIGAKDFKIYINETKETLSVVKIHQGHIYEIKKEEEIIAKIKKGWAKNWKRYKVNIQQQLNNINLYAFITILSTISIDLVENK